MDFASALTFPCRLPADRRGVLSGPSYHPFLVAGRHNRYSTGWSRYSPKTGRRIQCLSGGEWRLSYLLDVTPSVLDYREQYPWVTDDLLREIRLYPEAKIARNRVRTVDFVVTVLGKDGAIRYEVISFKLSWKCKDPKVQRRLQSETTDCEDFGWRWTLCTEKNLTGHSVISAIRIMRWAGAVPFDDVHSRARRLSDYVQNLNRGQTLDRLLGSASFKFKVSLDDAYQLFAASVCLGYVPVNLDAELSISKPLSLL